MKSARRLTLVISGLMILPFLVAGGILGVNAWLKHSSGPLTELLDFPTLIILFLFIIVCCVAVASALSRRIVEQLSFLTHVGKSVGVGKRIPYIQKEDLYQELRPLYQHLKTHTEFHQEINGFVKELLGDSPIRLLELRSEDDDFIKLLNAFASRFQHVQQVIHAISERNLALLEDMDENKLGPSISTHTLINELNNLSSESQFYIEQLLRNASQIGSICNQSSQDMINVTKRMNEILQTILKITSTMQTLAGYVQGQSLLQENSSLPIQQLINSLEGIVRELTDLKELLKKTPVVHDISDKIQSSLGRMTGMSTAMQEDAERSIQVSQEALKNVHDGKEVMERAVEGIHDIKYPLNGLFDIVRRLGERSEEVIETLEVISDIADHTNLLAINAAIISAHAGEHGRDFAVIADEIGKFAERTRESADEIESLLKRIRADFEEATQAIEISSKAMSEGHELSLHAGDVLETLASGFDAGKSLAVKIADSAAGQTREHNCLREAMTELEDLQQEKQEQLSQTVSQLLQILENIRGIATEQAEEDVRITKNVEQLNLLTKGLGQATEQHVDAGRQVVEAAEYVQKLIQRTSLGIEKAMQLSTELFTIGSNLAFTIGEFTLSKLHVPPSQRNVPSIGFIRRSSGAFFTTMLQGVKDEAAQRGLEVIELNSNNEATTQVANVNTLLKYPMLQGIILCPTDVNIAKKLVQKGNAQNIAFVAADETIATTLSARSSNREGGRKAAELFMQHLQPNAEIGIFTDQTVESMAKRALGFRQKAEQYPFDLIEIYCDTSAPEVLKSSMRAAIGDTPGLQGIFLTNEDLTSAYLSLLHGGQLPERNFLTVGYDRTPAIEQAILNGEMLGAIFQHPEEIGRQAFRLLYKLLKHQIRLDDVEERTIYLSTRTVTKESFSAPASEKSLTSSDFS